MDSLTEAVTGFLGTCPLMEGKLNTDCSLPGQSGFSVKFEDTAPMERQYIDGSCERRLDFSVEFNGFYSSDSIQNTVNRAIQENLVKWIEDSTPPSLPGACSPVAINTLQFGMRGADALKKTAHYFIKCRLIYLE